MGQSITDPDICHSTESTWIDITNSFCLQYTDCISNSVILSNEYVSLLSSLCTCTQVKKMVLQMKLLFLSDWHQAPRVTLKLSKVLESCTAQCKMLLFYAKTIMKRFIHKLAHLKKKELALWLCNFLVQYFMSHCKKCC